MAAAVSTSISGSSLLAHDHEFKQRKHHAWLKLGLATVVTVTLALQLVSGIYWWSTPCNINNNSTIELLMSTNPGLPEMSDQPQTSYLPCPIHMSSDINKHGRRDLLNCTVFEYPCTWTSTTAEIYCWQAGFSSVILCLVIAAYTWKQQLTTHEQCLTPTPQLMAAPGGYHLRTGTESRPHLMAIEGLHKADMLQILLSFFLAVLAAVVYKT